MPKTQELAEAVLTLAKKSWIEVSQETADLTESEYLSLDYLAHNPHATVGDVHKQIKVLPAQMSRIVRNLESEGLVKCEINPDDKRKINLLITPAGRRSYQKFHDAKLKPLLVALDRLTSDERTQFMNLANKMMG